MVEVTDEVGDADNKENQDNNGAQEAKPEEAKEACEKQGAKVDPSPDPGDPRQPLEDEGGERVAVTPSAKR